MSIVLYKAKRKDNKAWVCGYNIIVNKKWENEKWYLECYMTEGLSCNQNLPEIMANLVEVDCKTLCRFSGITDINNDDIFENDFLTHRFHNRKVKVSFKDGSFNFEDIGLDSIVEIAGNCHEVKRG